MSHVVFVSALFAGAALFVAGATRLMSPAPRLSPLELRVLRQSGLRATTLSRSLGLVEATIALVASVPLTPHLVRAGVALTGAAAFTAVGAYNVRKSGQCGCGPSVREVGTLPALFRRNGIIFGALVLGAIAGPTSAELSRGAAGYGMAGLLSLYVAGMGLLLIPRLFGKRPLRSALT